MAAMAKHSADILTWARRGAEARWHELQAEVAHLVKSFPHLGGLTATKTRKGRKSTAAASDVTPVKRRRSKMSAAQKKAVSARMKKYWAERRNAKK
jgi:hypothetical protein